MYVCIALLLSRIICFMGNMHHPYTKTLLVCTVSSYVLMLLRTRVSCKLGKVRYNTVRAEYYLFPGLHCTSVYVYYPYYFLSMVPVHGSSTHRKYIIRRDITTATYIPSVHCTFPKVTYTAHHPEPINAKSHPVYTCTYYGYLFMLIRATPCLVCIKHEYSEYHPYMMAGRVHIWYRVLFRILHRSSTFCEKYISAKGLSERTFPGVIHTFYNYE